MSTPTDLETSVIPSGIIETERIGFHDLMKIEISGPIFLFSKMVFDDICGLL